jgi:uncharacterized membrane protein YjgN (DUF898 family)
MSFIDQRIPMEDAPSNLEAALDRLKTSHSRSNRLRVTFTGSGSEYFRIWIVNLLLIFVTLGIYFPWAKVRRMRYFYGNTVVDGEPLGFHGDPKKMFKGFVLVGVLFGLYSVAGNFSPMAGFVALLSVVAIWPALLKSSIQFRQANTSWRGLRFRFHGNLADAYWAAVPLFFPGIVFVGIAAIAPDVPERVPLPVWLAWLAGGTLLATLAAAPLLLWNLKKYQHNNYGLASLQTHFKAGIGSFYLLFAKALGVVMLAVLACMAAVMGVVLVLGTGLNFDSIGKDLMLAGSFGAFAGILAVFVLIKPYVVARMQNLVWTQTGNASMRFVSALRFKSLLWLTLKNWLLVVLTLGLYWPFAAIALARLRLEAVEVKTRFDTETLVSYVKAMQGDTAGDAAGDFFGIDIGL